MQKGFATLEVIFAVLIIAVLATCAVPNAARMIDRVALNYETKRLYTEMRFLQSYDRMAFMKNSHFDAANSVNSVNDESFRLLISQKKYIVEKNSSGKIFAEHYFSNGMTVDKGKKIKFDDMGKVDPATSDTLTFTSRRGKKLYFVFDTVGRFRGSRKPPS